MKTLDLFGVIGDAWDGFTDKQVADELKGYEGPLTVRINSPGGFAYDGIAIYNVLKPHAPDVEVVGLAASAASVVAMAGKTIKMATGSEMMIHDAWGIIAGNATETRQYADHLEKLSGSIATIYAERTGGRYDAIRSMMQLETWMSAEEAAAFRFADGIEGEAQPDPEGAQAVLAAMGCRHACDEREAAKRRDELLRKAMIYKTKRHRMR